MKIHYKKELDTLFFRFSRKKVKNSHKFGRTVVGRSASGEMVNLCVFGGLKLIKSTNRSLPEKLREEILAVAI